MQSISKACFRAVGHQRSYVIVTEIIHIAGGLRQVLVSDMLPGAREESSVRECIQSWTRRSFVCPTDCVVVMGLIVVALLVELKWFLPWDDMIGGGYEGNTVAMVMAPGRRQDALL